MCHGCHFPQKGANLGQQQCCVFIMMHQTRWAAFFLQIHEKPGGCHGGGDQAICLSATACRDPPPQSISSQLWSSFQRRRIKCTRHRLQPYFCIQLQALPYLPPYHAQPTRSAVKLLFYQLPAGFTK